MTVIHGYTELQWHIFPSKNRKVLLLLLSLHFFAEIRNQLYSMLFTTQDKKKINEWYLRVIYAHVTYSYKVFLEKKTSVSKNHMNSQLLAAKMFKVSEGKYAKNQSEIFPESHRLTYKIRHQPAFVQKPIKTARYESESAASLK